MNINNLNETGKASFSNMLGESGIATINYDPDGTPVLLSAIVFGNRVEHVYRQEYIMSNVLKSSNTRIFKIITTWKNGQTSCIKVMGKYVPPCAEYYYFD